MRFGKVNAFQDSWWIDEAGVGEPAKFLHSAASTTEVEDSVSFDRDPNNFGQAINITVLSTFTNRHLAERIVLDHGLPKSAADKIITTIFESIADAAAGGGEVSLRGFGKFKMQHRGARQGRNPNTGETMTIAASRKITFAPAKALKDKIAD